MTGRPARSRSPRRRSGLWPWLVQVGACRAGWYSDDLLDNLARPSATEIVGDRQHVVFGDRVPMPPFGPPTDRTAFRVAERSAATT